MTATVSREGSLWRSASALYVLQLANYVFPLLTLPWLTRVLGPEGMGRIGFATAVVVYFVLAADYGFNLSATRQVAVVRDDREALSHVLWHTLAVKLLLALAGFAVLCLLCQWVPRFVQDRVLITVSYLTVVGTALTPNWFFQGTERQMTLSGISIAVRALSVALVFLLVRGHDDVVTAAAITGGASTLAALVGLGVLLVDRSVSRVRLQPRALLDALRGGWHLFLSNASVSLYTTTNTVVLGLVAGNASVGFYSCADKLNQLAYGLLTPLNQALYPRVSRLMHESPPAAFALLRRMLPLQVAIGGALSLALFFAAPLAIRTAFGPAFAPSAAVLRWLSFLPLIIGLSNVFGIQTLVPLGLTRAFSRILMVAGLLGPGVVWLLAGRFGARGAAMAILFTESLVTSLMLFTLIRHGVPLFTRRPGSPVQAADTAVVPPT